MAVTQSEIRSGAYYDSVVLMHLQRSLAGLPGVLDAGVVMGTAANKDINQFFTSLSASMSDGLPMAKPTRKPASECDFDSVRTTSRVSKSVTRETTDSAPKST